MFLLLLGENRGQKRQIYTDEHGKHFYWQGNRTKRLYLEDYIDENGNPRNANGSTIARQQFAAMNEPITPQVLFIDEEEKVEEVCT